MDQSRAAVLFELGKPLNLITLTLPKLQTGQVLVDVAYSGICHTQLLEIQGKRGQDPYLPHTLGHEGSGVVIEVGPGVTKIKPGDHVVLTWIKGKGMDVPRVIYKSEHCDINSGAISTFMQRTIISENRVVRIPKEMPLREAALLGCAVPTGAGIVLNSLKMTPGQSIAIWGVGGIGLSAVLCASMVGASEIFAIDIHKHKLDQAGSLGATRLINASCEDANEIIQKVTKGRGVDFSIEAAGTKTTMESSFQCVRDGGGICVLAGNLPKGEKISIDPFNLIRGKRIIGTWGGETDPDRDIPKYVELFNQGKLKLNKLVTHEYTLENVNQALNSLEKGDIGRALIH